jgi:hypothetical protein
VSADKVDVLAVMDRLQFGYAHVRCPICAGFDCGPNGETDKAHTDDCPVPKARAIVAELIAAARHMRANLCIAPETRMDAVVGPTYIVHGIALNRLDAILAKVPT